MQVAELTDVRAEPAQTGRLPQSPNHLALIVGFCGIGVLLRVIQYLHHNSYWNDEAALVMNILRRGYRELLTPLDFAQAAPPMFLWVQRWLYTVAGSSEYVQRALPALLGVAVVPLFAMLAWRVLGRGAAVWAVAWFAINDRMIPQVCEVKQYSADIFFATLLLFAGFGVKRETSGSRRLGYVAAIATVSMWFSFPSALVFGGVAMALLPSVIRARRGWIWAMALLAPPIASGAAVARLLLTMPRDSYLNEFWAPQFFDWRHPLLWLPNALFDVCDYPFASIGGVVMLIAGIGAWTLWRQRRGGMLAAAAWTLVFALIASALRLYPFGGSRVCLYLFPALFLVMGAGVTPWPDCQRWICRNWWLVPGAVAGLAIVQCAPHIVRPTQRSNIRPVVKYVYEHRAADEPIYLAGGGVLPQTRVSGRNVEFLCYWPGNEDNIFRTMVSPAEIRSPRFWVVYSLISTEKLSRIDPLKAQLDAVAVPRGQYTSGAAGAILYELRRQR